LIYERFDPVAAEKAGILGVRTRHVNESENQVSKSPPTAALTGITEGLQCQQ
jgi:hypothetical protein